MKKSKTLKLFLRGGLGNQLFQVFALEKISEDLGRIPVINIDWYDSNFQKSKKLSARRYALGDFSTFDYIQVEANVGYSKGRNFREKLSLASRGFLAPLLGYQLEFDNRLHRFLEMKKNVDLMGYFIRYNEVVLHRSLISKRLNAISAYSIFEDAKLDSIERGNFVAIHLRLTDYEKFPEIFGVTNLDYFLRAIRLINGTGVDTGNLIVFTDDCISARQFFGKNIPVKRFICPESSLSATEQMLLMSSAKWLICSNSTFSWWAGFLSDPSKTEVIFPSEYMKGVSSREYGLEVSGWNYL